MLTAQASAALLKTLEEPPAHVVFVLATTDPQKVLPTIKSRTQQYDFHLLSADELAEHVAWVIHDAGLDLEPDVIDHVVRQGAGSARDTLSALDQVAAAGGVFDEIDSLDDLLDAVADGDGPAALVAIAAAVSAGRDPRVLGEALLARFRDVFLMRMGGAVSHLPSDERTRVEAWAERLGPRATTRALELVGDALAEMRNAPDPRIPLEVALVKITRTGDDVDLSALLERVRRLEEALASGAAPTPPPPVGPAAGGEPAPVDRPTGSAPSTPAPSASADAPGRSSRPAPPPVPGRGRSAGGVAAAREALARSQRTEPTPPRAAPSTDGQAPTTPQPDTPGEAPSPSPSPGAPPVPTARSGPSEPSSSSGAADPAPPPSATPPGPVDTGSPADLDTFTRGWNDQVIPELRGATKAMFNVGELTAFDGTTATLSLPNDVHRQKCEQRLSDVEAVARRHLGSSIRLRLVVGDHGVRPADDPRGSGDDGGSPDDFDLGDIDVDALEDAPDEPTGGIDALTEAFPGAEFVDE